MEASEGTTEEIVSPPADFLEDVEAYRGHEPILARATRKLGESMPKQLKRAYLLVKGEDGNPQPGPTVIEYMDAAADAFAGSRREDAWFCLKAVELIVNMEGFGSQYRARVRQLRRGVHTAPMTVTEPSLRGRRKVSIYNDKQFQTSFYRCSNSPGARKAQKITTETPACIPGEHFGVRNFPEYVVKALTCPYGCGGKIEPHLITLEEQRNGDHA